MKVLYRKIIIFCVIFCFVILGLGIISIYEPLDDLFIVMTNSSDYVDNTGTDEIKRYIEKVRQQDNSTQLIIGDSMCCQMFNNLQQYNPDFTIVGSNGAITMAGQYLLVNEYLKNHEGVTDIYIFLHPGSLGRGFDTVLAYQYIVMPFGVFGSLSDLDGDTIIDMKSVYGAIFLNTNVIKWLEESAVGRKIYFNILKDYGKKFEEDSIYEIANQYTEKIYEKCKERNIELHLYPSPVSENLHEDIQKRKMLYQDTWLINKFPDFFERVLYFPKEQAKDGTHFSGEYATQESFNIWIKMIFKDSELLETLKFQ